MITALITGQLAKDAELKTSSTGKEYLNLIVKVPGEAHQYARVSLFGDDVESCSSLCKGDAVAVVGTLSVGVWEGNTNGPTPSLTVMAHRAISAAGKKPKQPRQARAPKTKKPTAKQFKAAAEAQSIRTVSNGSELADDLPWHE